MDSLKSIVHRDSPNAKKGGSTSPKTKHARDGSAASSSSAGAMPPPAAPHQPAPPSAQNAAYAAFAPEPGSRSEAREFGAANPAAARVSPGLQAGAHTDAAARQRAEQSASDPGDRADPAVVEAERVAKSRMPKYEGLPSNFELLDKMGECVGAGVDPPDRPAAPSPTSTRRPTRSRGAKWPSNAYASTSSATRRCAD